jgi:hypothetical protein
MVKDRVSRPILVCRKNTGPEETILIHPLTRSIRGSHNGAVARTQTMSSPRFQAGIADSRLLFGSVMETDPVIAVETGEMSMAAWSAAEGARMSNSDKLPPLVRPRRVDRFGFVECAIIPAIAKRNFNYLEWSAITKIAKIFQQLLKTSLRRKV